MLIVRLNKAGPECAGFVRRKYAVIDENVRLAYGEIKCHPKYDNWRVHLKLIAADKENTSE